MRFSARYLVLLLFVFLSAYLVSSELDDYVFNPFTGNVFDAIRTFNGSDFVSGNASDDTQVQYNDGGVIAGDNNFTWNKTSRILNLSGVIRIIHDDPIPLGANTAILIQNTNSTGVSGIALRSNLLNTTATFICGGSGISAAPEQCGLFYDTDLRSFNVMNTNTTAFPNASFDWGFIRDGSNNFSAAVFTFRIMGDGRILQFGNIVQNDFNITQIGHLITADGDAILGFGSQIGLINASDAYVITNNKANGSGSSVFLVESDGGDNRIHLYISKEENNTLRLLGNNWGIMPERITTICNDMDVLNLSNINNIYSCFNRTRFMDADTPTEGAGLTVHGMFDVWEEVNFRNSLTSFGDVEFIMNGTDFDIINGSLHLQTPVTFVSGFDEGDELIRLSATFPGTIVPFVNDQVDLGNWIPVTSNFCDLDQCGEADGVGEGNISMTASFTTLDGNETTLSFVYSLVNLIGSDEFTVDVDNGSGPVEVFSDSGTDNKVSQSISLGSDFDNISNANVTFTCTASKGGRRCFVDTVKINTTATTSTSANQSDFDSEICGADGSRGVDGNCNIGIRWDAETQQWIFSGNINASGTITGGLSGTGTTNNIPKWSGTTTLTNSIASDDGTNFTIAGNLQVNDTMFVDTSTERVGIGTTSPTAKLHILKALADGSSSAEIGTTNLFTLAGSTSQSGIITGLANTIVNNNAGTITQMRAQSNIANDASGDNSGNVNKIIGLFNSVEAGNSVTGTQISTGIANDNLIRTVNSKGRMNTAKVVNVKLSSGAGGIISNGFGIFIETPVATGTFTNNVGLLIEDQAGPANTQAIVVEGGESEFNAGASTVIPMIIKGAASQSANLQEWQNSSGGVLAKINSAGELNLPLVNDAATPTLSFGGGTDGIYTSQATVLDFSLGGSSTFQMGATEFRTTLSTGPGMFSTTPSATFATVYPDRSDINTGLGHAAADVLSLIAGGVNGLNINETGGVARVGIGTTSPLAKVHIQSASVGTISPVAAADELVVEGSGDSGITLYSNNSNSGFIVFADQDANFDNYIEMDHGSNQFKFNVGGTEVMRFTTANTNIVAGDFRVFAGNMQILVDNEHMAWGVDQDATILYDGTDMVFDSQNVGSGDFIFNNGRVGIGTTTPDTTLHVGDDSLTASGNLGTPSVFIENSGISNSFSALNVQNSFFVQNSGNVGIGTTSPNTLLHVAGTDTDGSLTLERVDASILNDQDIGTIAFRGGESIIGNVARITAEAQGNWAGGDSPTKLTFFTTPDGSTASVANMVLDKDGNVGIGTTNPQDRLHLLSAGFSAVILEDSSASVNEKVWEFGGESGIFTIRRMTDIFISQNPAFIIQADDDIIMQEGNVGIGTTNPSQLLHINHASSPRMRFSVADSSTDFSEIYLNTATGPFRIEYTTPNTSNIDFNPLPQDGTSKARFRLFRLTNTTGATDFEVHVGDGTNNVNTLFSGNGDSYFNAVSGNVGIGTTSPSEKLSLTDGTFQINSTFPFILLVDSDAAAETDIGGEISFRRGDGTGGTEGGSFFMQAGNFVVRTQHSAGQVIFRTGDNVEGMRIDSSGNVGIGTTTPDGPLHVQSGTAGSVVANVNADELVVEGSGNTGISINVPDASVGGIRWNSPSTDAFAIFQSQESTGLIEIASNIAGGEIALKTAINVEAVRIDASGNVGIGTSNPGALLHVNQTGQIEKIAIFEGVNNGGTQVVIDANNADASLLFQNAGVSEWVLGFDDSDSDKFKINTGSSLNTNNKFTIQDDGNVGIGTTSPDTKLQVQQTLSIDRDGNQRILLDSSTATGNFIQSKSRENNKKVFRIDALHDESGSASGVLRIDFRVGGVSSPTTVMSIHEDGEVGIGTTNPGVALDVVGTIQSSNQIFYAFEATGGQTIPTTFVNITWDTEIREDALFTHAANGHEIQVNEDGFYEWIVQCSADTSGSSRDTSNWQLVTNSSGSFVVVPGTQRFTYHRIAPNDGKGSLSINSLIDLNAGDVVILQGLSDQATAVTTVADGCSIRAVRI